MGDMGDTFRAMTAEKKKRHAGWKEKNRRQLKIAGMKFTDKGETLLFRDKGKPKVDFFPSTGRWRVPSEQKTYSGHARSFMGWYARQEVNDAS